MINNLLIFVILINLFLMLVTATSIPIRKGNLFYYCYLINIFSIICWTMSLLLFINSPDSSLLTLAKSAHVSASIIASSFYTFTLFPIILKDNSVKRIKYALLINIVIIFLIIFSDKIVKDTIFLKPFHIIIYGELFLLYILYTLYFFISGFKNLYIKYLSTTDVTVKKQTFIVFLGYLLSGIVAIPTDLLLPYIGYFKLIWLGPVATLILTVSSTYAIRKHGLFSAKILNIEFFVLLLWLLFLMKIITGDQLVSFFDILATFIFILSGILLLKKVKTQEEEKSMTNIITQQLIDEIKTKDRLTSLITHNLAGPLTSIKFYAEDIDNDDDIKPLIDTLTWKIKDLINISNIKNPVLEEKKEIDLSELILKILQNREFILEQKSITVFFTAKKQLVNFAEVKLRDSITCIINNLIRFNTSNCIYIEIEKTNNLTINIFDNSPRLHPTCPYELLQKFSDKLDYFEASIVASDIGLYIAKETIKSEYGEFIINIKTKPYVKFEIKIPV